MKVVLLTWYSECDLAKVINDEFRSRGITATSFQCVDMTLEGVLKATEDADMCLWWSWMTPPLEIATRFVEQTKSRIKHVMFNIDDPFCWTMPENDCEKRAALFHAALVCSSAALEDYAAQGCKALRVYPPVDKVLFSPKRPEEPFRFDVCMLLTNLYDSPTTYPGQLWSRRSMIETLRSMSDVSFACYGNEGVAAVAKDCYKGWCSFEGMADAFKYARVVISTHVTDANEYLNRRCIEAMACGCLVLVDDIKGIRNVLKDGVVYLKAEEALESQVRDVLTNYDSFSETRARGVEIANELGDVKTFVDTCLSI